MEFVCDIFVCGGACHCWLYLVICTRVCWRVWWRSICWSGYQYGKWIIIIPGFLQCFGWWQRMPKDLGDLGGHGRFWQSTCLITLINFDKSSSHLENLYFWNILFTNDILPSAISQPVKIGFTCAARFLYKCPNVISLSIQYYSESLNLALAVFS